MSDCAWRGKSTRKEFLCDNGFARGYVDRRIEGIVLHNHAEPADQQARALYLVGPLQSRFRPEELSGVRPALSCGQAFVVQEGGTAYHHYRVADNRRLFGFRGCLSQPCYWRCFDAFNHGRINRWPATVSTCCLEFRATGRKSYRLHFSVNYEFSSCWHPSRLVVVSPATLEKHVAP